MLVSPHLECFDHSRPLSTRVGKVVEETDALVCDSGCRFPVIKNIPRFVESTNYASAFGLQWNAFRKTQLDSYTGTTISYERLARCLGGSLDIVRGKSVLEAGCGAGRFTEILLSAGARVFACDLSEAVEANYENCKEQADYFVCQADIQRLPVRPASFDIVLCLGVIQHTPDPQKTIAALASYLRPGGMLVIDHYSTNYPYTFSRKLLRQLLIRLPASASKSAVIFLSRLLLPLHKMLWSKRRGMSRLSSYLAKVSPVVDYYGSYPQLGTKLLEEWAILDTHDMLTDRYKHLRSKEEIESYLASCNLVGIEASYAGNGVEARARMPVAEKQIMTEEVVG
ncbi:MAG: class I SAM-dependent methyltransferase [Acidobacteriota bacterium]|nr:class I SAM-dependent methyltransferase [Acidobacteriota bacterium]